MGGRELDNNSVFSQSLHWTSHLFKSLHLEGKEEGKWQKVTGKKMKPIAYLQTGIQRDSSWLLFAAGNFILRDGSPKTMIREKRAICEWF